MIRVHANKDTSIHGTYKSKEVTLKLLMENKTSLGEQLNQKVDIFHEGEEGTFVCSFNNCIYQTVLRLDKDGGDTCEISLTKKMTISKDHLPHIESMLKQMGDACTIETQTHPAATSSTDLLNKNGF